MAEVQHPTFWYFDGSVIIEVENTKFKLHQSMLEKRSAYFASLFQVSPKVELDEQRSNAHIPAYRISDTTVNDFAALLTLIEEPMYVSAFFFSFLTANGLLTSVRNVMQEVHRRRPPSAHIGSHSARRERVVVRRATQVGRTHFRTHVACHARCGHGQDHPTRGRSSRSRAYVWNARRAKTREL